MHRSNGLFATLAIFKSWWFVVTLLLFGLAFWFFGVHLGTEPWPLMLLSAVISSIGVYGAAYERLRRNRE